MRTLILALSLVVTSLSQAFAQAPPPELIARAEAGDTGAMIEVSVALLNLQDVEGARRWALRGAEAGDGEAMNLYAVVIGSGEDADSEAARLWEDRAIAAGSQGAVLNRASRLITEDGSDAAWAQSIAIFQSLNTQQGGDALTNFALDYAQSQHATPARVRELYRIAAERSSPAGQWHYGMMLRQGQGGGADVAQAYEWVRRSGEAGYIDGMISTAVMLAMGEGVTQNDAEARLWYHRAAERSSAHALRGLGFMLITGEGGAVDEARGWAYMLLAAEGGDQIAINVLNQYRRSLPAETMQAATAIRTEWLATHEPPR